MKEINVVQVIENTYDLICKAKELKSEEEVINYIGKEENPNFEILVEFYDDLYAIEPMYLYRNFQDKEQSNLSLKCQEIYKWIMANKYVFERTNYYGYIPDNLIYSIMDREEKHFFSLMDKKNLIDFYSELEYQHFRTEMENILQKQEESKITHNEKCFLKERDSYYKNFFSHSMNLLEKDFFMLPPGLVDDFLKELDNHAFIDEIINKSNTGKLKFEDSNLIYQYSRFVLKMKSIFKKEELYNDKLIRGIYDGTITNPEILKNIFSNQNVENIEKEENKKIGIPFDYIKVFKELLKRDGKDTSNIYYNLVQHFKSVNMSDYNINQIFMEIVRNDKNEDNALDFLAYLGIRENVDLSDFCKSDKLDENMYLVYNSNVFDMLKKVETKVMEGRVIPIPYNYAIENIDLLSKEAYDNLQTLIENGYYTEEQRNTLKQELIRLNRYIEKPNYSYEEVLNKLRNSINEDMRLSEEELRACISSIIQNKLKDKGIDIGKNIYFGENETSLGTNLQSDNFKAIWINNKLIRDFCRYSSETPEKYNLFVTVFHEIQHSIQLDNIEKGKIDYLTYNFIKEEIIREQDKEFYEANYGKMFIEEDARQNGIIEAMKFLKELGIKGFDIIYDNFFKEKLRKELNSSNINQDSKKNIPFRELEKTSINDYLEKLINMNPEIIEQYGGVLKIEFNQDGSQKELEQTLDEFNEIEEENEKDAKFSIYYGIINRKANEIGKRSLSEELNQKIKEFSKRKTRLISAADFRHYFSVSEPFLNKLMLDVITKEINAPKTSNIEEDIKDSKDNLRKKEHSLAKESDRENGDDEYERD